MRRNTCQYGDQGKVEGKLLSYPFHAGVEESFGKHFDDAPKPSQALYVYAAMLFKYGPVMTQGGTIA